jgi:hypothetical protein
VTPEGLDAAQRPGLRPRPASLDSRPVSTHAAAAATAATLQEALTKQYAQMVPSLAALARSMVRDLDPQVGVAGGAGGPRHAAAWRSRSPAQPPYHQGAAA